MSRMRSTCSRFMIGTKKRRKIGSRPSGVSAPHLAMVMAVCGYILLDEKIVKKEEEDE